MAVGGGETEKDPSGWTVDTLHSLIDQRFRDLELRLEQRFQAQQAALAEKDATTQARLDILNEHRAQTGDLLAKTMLRDEIESRFQAVERTIEQRMGAVNDKLDSSIRQRAEAISVINSRLDLMQGGRKGVDDVRIWVIGAVTMAASIAGIALALTR